MNVTRCLGILFALSIFNAAHASPLHPETKKLLNMPIIGGVANEHLAHFIYHLPQYIRWPMKKGYPNEYTLCTKGEVNNKGVEEEIAFILMRNQSEHVVLTRELEGDLSACHMVYLGRALSTQQLEKLLQELQGKKIVTVSDRPDFAKQGGMVGFSSRTGNRVVLEINTTSMDRERIAIDALLMKHAVLFR